MEIGDTHELNVSTLGIETLAYNPETGQAERAAVGTLIRHDAPEAMYRLRTGCGREVTLTGDHNLWVLREGRLTLIETADARPTDYLPVPERLGEPLAPETVSVDLLASLPDSGLFVHAQDQVAAFVDEHGTAAFARPFAASGAGNPSEA